MRKSSVLEGVQREEEGEVGEVEVGVRDERGRLRQHQLFMFMWMWMGAV